MSDPTGRESWPRQRVICVTGPSGAGRTTAINAFEDLGHEAIENIPIALVPRLFEGPPLGRPLALGLDVRTRDFSIDALLDLTEWLSRHPGIDSGLLYLDCSPDALIRRYSETRRRHPMAPAEHPGAGVMRELDLLQPIRQRADFLINTSEFSPHDLRAEIASWFGDAESGALSVVLHSFSYKRGMPRGLDMVFDCRFLNNPHWVPELRALDGRDPAVAAHVMADPRFTPFLRQVHDLLKLLLPAQVDEGKAHLSVGFGCTGGQHRSVMMTEVLADALAHDGWRVSKRHRELERCDAALTSGRARPTDALSAVAASGSGAGQV